MKVQVSEASGPVLCYLVCMVEMSHLVWGETIGLHAHSNQIIVPELPEPACYSPFMDWAQGGPILTREHISRTIDHSGLWIAYWTDGYTDGDEGKKWMQCDRSELVAGLRCFVVSKLGNEVEVPDELA